MVVGARLAGQKLLIYWDFATQTSLGFTENGLEKASYLVLKQPLVAVTVCRTAATR